MKEKYERQIMERELAFEREKKIYQKAHKDAVKELKAIKMEQVSPLKSSHHQSKSSLHIPGGSYSDHNNTEAMKILQKKLKDS